MPKVVDTNNAKGDLNFISLQIQRIKFKSFFFKFIYFYVPQLGMVSM